MKQRRRVLCILVILFILLFNSLSQAEQAAMPINLVINKGAVITLKEPSKRVSISNPEIADLNLVSPTEIILNGKKVGATSLIVWDSKGPKFFDVMVTAEDKFGHIGELRERIKELAPNDDIRVEVAKDTIILLGSASNQQIVNKAVQMAQAYALASEVTTTTKYSAGVTSVEEKSTGKVLNQIIIKEAQQVLLEVRVAQMDKSKLKELGLSFLVKGKSGEGFSNLVGAPSGRVTTENFIGPGITTEAEGIAGNVPGISAIKPLDPFQFGVSHFPSGVGVVLKALSEKGLAKILAEPNLTVRSGERGIFHVGTRFPVQTVTGAGAAASVSVTYEEIGIKLNFAPEVLETNVIRLKIDPAEVSNITDFVRTEFVIAPIIDTRTVKTSVDLKEGESLILAGLLSEETRKNIRKIPILADIPIFGALFRSTEDELRERELVFFITPRMVKPIPHGVTTELPGEKPLTPEEEREFQWIPLPGAMGR